MTPAILVLNAGSSSLKFSVFATQSSLALVYRGEIEASTTKGRWRWRSTGSNATAQDWR